MLKSLFILVFLFFAFVFVSALPLSAQTKSCNLRLKVYAYDASSSKNRIKDVDVTLKNSKSKEKKSLILSASSLGFENLAEGNYRIDVSKQGYKEKSKEIKIECEFADENSIYWQNVYLWKHKSTPETDLQADVAEVKNESNAETINTSESESKLKSDKPRVFGKVIIQVLIDEDGNVVSAKVISGDSLLANAAVKAARRAKFVPTMLASMPVKVSGNITYNFVP